MVESEGSFEIDTWEAVVEIAHHICHGESSNEDIKDVSMDIEANRDMESFVRSIVGAKVAVDEGWRQDIK